MVLTDELIDGGTIRTNVLHHFEFLLFQWCGTREEIATLRCQNNIFTHDDLWIFHAEINGDILRDDFQKTIDLLCFCFHFATSALSSAKGNDGSYAAFHCLSNVITTFEFPAINVIHFFHRADNVMKGMTNVQQKTYTRVVMHPFDRYTPFTDVALLKAWSEKPLRKSIRVNTLKCSVDDFKDWAKKQGWELQAVPWCTEGFFVERENRERALGRDLRHLLGHFYMQEAASMLPVTLLDPQPGEIVLDLCAAPGSKTTQIADALQGRGVIVANDMQEKRLRTLVSALYRSGALNVVVTRKVGQWFAKHMTERFDRVLCDAPCTAQGTARKDPSALSYCSPSSIAANARLQRELLEAAIHAVKIGGRVVYSTCTLTPEENEEVVRSLLNKYCDQIKPLAIGMNQNIEKAKLSRAEEDSRRVQAWLNAEQEDGQGNPTFPAYRLWPHTEDTEGFFCAVIEKTERTREPLSVENVRRTMEALKERELRPLKEIFSEIFGSDFLHEGETLLRGTNQLFLATRDAVDFPLPVSEYACGIPYAKDLKDGRFRVTNDCVQLRGREARTAKMMLGDEELEDVLKGQDIACDASLHGDTVLQWKEIPIGISLAKEGKLLNRLPRWVVRQG